MKKIVTGFLLGIFVLFLLGASFYTTQQILNRVLVVGGTAINAHLTTQQALNAVYSPADTALNIWLDTFDEPVTFTDSVTMTGDVVIIEGNLNTGFHFQEILQDEQWKTTASGTHRTFYGGFTALSTDSLIMDSLRVLWYTDHADVYIDSVALCHGITRLAENNILLMGDGTNYGAGTAWAFAPATYDVDQRVSFDWRLKITYWVATSSAAGNGLCYSAKAYCHY